MYEKLSRPGWLGMEGNPSTTDFFSPCKQVLTKVKSGKVGVKQTDEVIRTRVERAPVGVKYLAPLSGLPDPSPAH